MGFNKIDPCPVGRVPFAWNPLPLRRHTVHKVRGNFIVGQLVCWRDVRRRQTEDCLGNDRIVAIV
ncbi:hypothetical protein J4E08_17115 [Sagittula sp. NFXS13]|uniref:hypothetical protein n=1 Tax=Sagittula sp. NFXS13 TaxID=2819095 RepID=UPI0032DF89C6